MCTHRVNSSVQYCMSSNHVSLGQGGASRPKSKAALSRRSPDIEAGEGMVDVCVAKRLRQSRKRVEKEKSRC